MAALPLLTEVRLPVHGEYVELVSNKKLKKYFERFLKTNLD